MTEVPGGRCQVLVLEKVIPLAPSTYHLSPRSGIQLGAELWRCRCFVSQQPGDDAVTMIATILNEDLVCIVAGDDDARDEHARHRRL